MGRTGESPNPSPHPAFGQVFKELGEQVCRSAGGAGFKPMILELGHL